MAKTEALRGFLDLLVLKIMARRPRLHGVEVFLMTALVGSGGVALGLVAAPNVESIFYQMKATDASRIALPTCAILLTALGATSPAVLRALRTDRTAILGAE